MQEVADTGFDWADIVEDVVARAGGQTATAEDVLKIRRGLRLLTEEWQAKGYNLWRVNETVVGVSGASCEVNLPRRIEDVLNVAVRRFGDRTDSTPSLRRISEAEWAMLTSKTVQGQPTQYCLRRSDPPVLLLYPQGGEGFWELIVTFIDRPARFERYDDLGDGEVPGRWLRALVQGLALDLAQKRPPYDDTLISRLKAEKLEATGEALYADRGRQRYRHRIS